MLSMIHNKQWIVSGVLYGGVCVVVCVVVCGVCVVCV